MSLTHSIMLTRADYHAKVKELGDASKSNMAKAYDYVSTKEDGGEHINFTSLYETLLMPRVSNLVVEPLELARVERSSLTKQWFKAMESCW